MKVIIIGATSGIGRELAVQMSRDGYSVGITGRRGELLNTLAQELPGVCFQSVMDLTYIQESVEALHMLITKMEGVDIIIISAGVGSIDSTYPLKDELDTVAVNVTGFTAMANTAYHYFSKNNGGHLVGVSSIAGLRGGPFASYNASKAYISSYLEGLSCRSLSGGGHLIVTDIRPGFVDTAMAQGEGLFWKASVEKAAKQIVKGIKEKRRIVYVTKRWRFVGWLISYVPYGLYRKLIG